MYNQGIGLQIENRKPHCEFLREGYFAKEECKFGREKQNQDDADSCLNKHWWKLILPLEADTSSEVKNRKNNFPLKTVSWDSFQLSERQLRTHTPS